MKKKNYFIYSLSCCLILFANNLFAQSKSAPLLKTDRLTSKNKSNPKLENNLLQIYEAVSDTRNRDTEQSRALLENPIYVIQEESILIELIAKENPSDLAIEAEAIGFKQTAAFGKILSGNININRLNELSTLSELRYARPMYKPVTRVGSVNTQGDTAMYTELARENFNLDGSGLKIGALSDSYNTLGGEAAGIASGDLPGAGNPNGNTTPVTVLLEYSGTGTDEARGMIELIHDVAPAAEIYARTAFEGEADFAQGILDLEAAGCDIIVDDVGYFTEPFFQDGVIAQAVDSVVSNGVLYFSSAGNSGRKSYESGFSDSGLAYGGGTLHDFDSGGAVDYAQEITIPNGVALSISFQWDDPFGSLPGSVASADTDMDIFMFDASFNRIAISNSTNIATGDPYEIMSYTNNTGSSMTAHIAIVHYAGPAPSFMKYKSWTNSITINEFDTESSTIVPHANSNGAIAVGAAAYYNTAAYGASPTSINSFSSAGGTPTFFDKVGNSITTVTRNKPELVGPDGTNTSFFGTDIAQDADSYPNFFGTSASAPHLAAGALLLLEAGATTKAEVIDAFTSTSEDMDDPSTSGGDSGFDFATGYGMAQVNSAITYFQSLPVELIDFSVFRVEKNAARILWSTATELNNLGFIIDHSTDNLDFETIAKINGRGFSLQTINYEHKVYDLEPGVHYFRLRQEDFDGTITDHGYVNMIVQSERERIWSSKKGDSHQIIMEASQDATLTINVFNSSGSLLMSNHHNVYEGERHVSEIASPEWPKGIYFYQVQIDGQSKGDVVNGKFRLD